MTTKKSTRFPFFKTICLIAMVFLSIACAMKAHASECSSCNHVYNGSGGNYNLNSGETLCVQSGTLSGNININGSNVTICISEGATYSPSNFNFTNNLKIVNRGTFIINGANINQKAYIDNYGVVEVQGNLNYNSDLDVKNYGTWINIPNFEFKKNSLFINDGYVDVRAEFSSEPQTSFVNNGRMKIAENFNPNGEFFNNGPLIAGEFININSQAKLINQCFLYATQGFNNNSVSTQNLGLIQTGAGKPVQLNQKYWQNQNGTLRGGSLINNAIVSGDGYYYFTGNTVNHAQFGSGSSNIQFHDETKTGTGHVFDAENVLAMVISTAYFQPMDTVAVKQMICPGAPSILPVELVSFTASRDGMLVEISWATASELNSDYFIIERSYDGFSFEEVGRTSGSGTTSVPQNYNFTDDESVNSLESIAYYRLKQVDFDGKSETFQIVSVDLSEKNQILSRKIGFYPNPTRDIINIPGSEGILKQFFSLSGNLIHSTREVVSDISHFVSGLYLLKIGELGEMVEKILKI